MRLTKRVFLAFLVIYFVPVTANALWWAVKDRPANYKTANWEATGILPAPRNGEAALYVMAARTGGMKGAISVHSWLVFKKPDEADYQRYEVVGWGTALRHNALAPDAYWYSNQPYIVRELHDEAAVNAIAKVEQAIAAYPHGKAGDYTIFPGPNSNTFVAAILRAVPEIGVVLPPTAVGRDYIGRGFVADYNKDTGDFRLSINGFGGLAIGRQSGIELNLSGLVAGIDFWPPGLKIPAIGRIGF
ncbi:MAG: Hypothetical protein BHV28_07230 [Candidatus Tokpelaia hoelldobleri]|uniref:DUF3750 domain-containing protein n=1 Tax=Candidatus Tokpelaia hoelldobleri TaxID=1902579 RepID=A0A1U9JU67_9HYPH|nr:MAG: Hypothetical protein BHV28_07230 [Candidatus Tokpelaia hoelldoblerii]